MCERFCREEWDERDGEIRARVSTGTSGVGRAKERVGEGRTGRRREGRPIDDDDECDQKSERWRKRRRLSAGVEVREGSARARRQRSSARGLCRAVRRERTH